MPTANKELKNFNKTIGKRIRLFRELQGMTQVELAKHLGFTSSGAISLIERGEGRTGLE